MSWKSIADLIVTEGDAPVALLGAPMEAGSVTPGRCDLAPAAVRKALKRFSTYDRDPRAGAVGRDPRSRRHRRCRASCPADGFAPIRDAVSAATAAHDLTILLGGNNAVTRPAAHGLGLPLDRDRPDHPRRPFRHARHGPGAEQRQPGPLPARGRPAGREHLPDRPRALRQHARRCTRTRWRRGSASSTIDDVLAEGIEAAIDAALERLSHVEAILVDFDIDVIDRAPVSRRARRAARRLAGLGFLPRRAPARRGAAGCALVDLTEFDPSLDVERPQRAHRRRAGSARSSPAIEARS